MKLLLMLVSLTMGSIAVIKTAEWLNRASEVMRSIN